MNRFTAIAGAAFIGLSLAGCSDNNDNNHDNGQTMDETVQFSSFVSDVFSDDANAEPREINDVNFDFSSDNSNEQAFDNELK